MPHVGLILLAAGGSTRMGRPKQLLPYEGRTLLRRAAEVAIESGCDPVVVVLGHEATKMRRELDGLPVHIEVNEDWEKGMGGSIRRGLRAVLGDRSVDAVAVMLCDQPHVTPAVLRELIERWGQSGKPVCASAYGKTVGPPCIFAASEFSRLAAIPEQQGAKQVIVSAPAVERVPFDAGLTDVDTPADYERLRDKHRS